MNFNTTTAVMPRLSLRRATPAHTAEGRRVDFLHVPLHERILRRIEVRPMNAVSIVEHLVRFFVVAILLGVAALVLYHTTRGLLSATNQSFAESIADAVSGVLCAIIIMDVLRTVMAEDEGLQLQPFIKIGIISAVREILSAGAHLSLGETSTTHLALTELKVNVAVVVGLAAALFLTRCIAGRSEGSGEQE